MMTQNEKVLAALRSRGDEGLTPLEALEEIGTMRLAARINDLHALLRPDEIIVTERVSRNGKSFARYVLRRRDTGQSTLW